jgi:hypothetical protein
MNHGDMQREAKLVGGEEKCKSAWRGVHEQYEAWRSNAWNSVVDLSVNYPQQSGVLRKAMKTVALDPALDPLHIPPCCATECDRLVPPARRARRSV